MDLLIYNSILHLTTNIALTICTAQMTSQGRHFWELGHTFVLLITSLFIKNYLPTIEGCPLSTLTEDSILIEI